MATLDDHLRRAAEHPELPTDFIGNVMLRIDDHEQQLKQQEFLRNFMLVSGSVLLFFLSLANLIIDVISAQTLDFLTLSIVEPGILLLQEGWLALWEALPLASLLFTVIMISLSAWSIGRLITSLPSSFQLREPHVF